MRINLVIIIVLFVAVIIMAFNDFNHQDTIPVIPPAPKVIGMFDPENKFAQDKNITIIGKYFAWNKNTVAITDEVKSMFEQNRTLLITIEPWPVPIGSRRKSNDVMLKEIVNGKYDQKIDSICSVLSTSRLPVYMRWGHEMELNNSRYPWSNATPEIYIQAYKHFVDRCRSQGSKIKFVWSPAGEQGLEKYWPDENYVDIIGLSVYSFDEYDKKYIGHQRSFNEVLEPKYNRVRGYKKPILISEMGVTGADDYKLEWLGQMMIDINKYENIIGSIYFNAHDPKAVWEASLSNPDWRLPSRFDQILMSAQ